MTAIKSFRQAFGPLGQAFSDIFSSRESFNINSIINNNNDIIDEEGMFKGLEEINQIMENISDITTSPCVPNVRDYYEES